jgi:hypothetical protein
MSTRAKLTYTSPAQETVLNGLDAVNDIKYFGHKPNGDSEELINRALKALKVDQFYKEQHRTLCRRKLELGLNLIVERGE